jgi:hypothetical protein
MALINYALSFLVRRGFTPVQTPFFMRKVRPLKECCRHMLDAPLAHRMLTLYS